MSEQQKREIPKTALILPAYGCRKCTIVQRKGEGIVVSITVDLETPLEVPQHTVIV
jgi:hypothetical protein